MNIGIDLDGVCYDFVEALQKEAKLRGYGDLPYALSWDFFKTQWGWTTDEYLRVFGTGVLSRRIFWDGEPVRGCVGTLQYLKDAGHRIVIVTHRDHPDRYVSYQMKLATVTWLYLNQVPHDSLMFEGSKTNLGLDILVDDAPHNIEAAQEAGEGAIIFDQPWNTHCRGVRAYGWEDLPQAIEYHTQLRAMREELPA